MIQVTENSRITVSDDEDDNQHENFYNKMSESYEQRQNSHDDYDVIDVDDDVDLEGGDSNWNTMNVSHNENHDDDDDDEDEDEDEDDDEDDDTQQTNNDVTEVTPHDEVMQNIEEVKLLKESKPQENNNLEGGLEEITLDNDVKTVAIENMIDFSQLKVSELKNLCSEKNSPDIAL